MHVHCHYGWAVLGLMGRKDGIENALLRPILIRRTAETRCVCTAILVSFNSPSRNILVSLSKTSFAAVVTAVISFPRPSRGKAWMLSSRDGYNLMSLKRLLNEDGSEERQSGRLVRDFQYYPTIE